MLRAGYGRYLSDPDWIGCPRAKTSETPCIARDGHLALADDRKCVGCNKRPNGLLKELRLIGALQYPDPTDPKEQADKLREIVHEITEPTGPPPTTAPESPTQEPKQEHRRSYGFGNLGLMAWSSDFTGEVPVLHLPFADIVVDFEPDDAAIAHHHLTEFLRDCAIHRRAPDYRPAQPTKPDWGHGPNRPVQTYTEDEIRDAAGGDSRTIDLLIRTMRDNRERRCPNCGQPIIDGQSVTDTMPPVHTRCPR